MYLQHVVVSKTLIGISHTIKHLLSGKIDQSSTQETSVDAMVIMTRQI